MEVNMETKTPIYDRELSLQLAGGKADLAEQMLGMLLAELPQLCEQANDAAAANDTDALFRTVHKINGSTRYCGVPALGEAADQLESLIKAGSTDIAAAMQRLNDEADRLIALKQ
jgi:two-component system sensor histidine kinase BarA